MLQKNLDILIFILIVTYIIIGSGLQIEYIIGGIKADNEDILYQASMIVKGHLGDEPDAPCAAATVDKDYLVSIASCFTDEFGKSYHRWYEAKIGAKNLMNKLAKVVGVEKIYIPGNYIWRTSSNNIAVIKLSESLDFSMNTRLSKLSLATSSSTYRKKVAILSGYGYNVVNVEIGRINTYTGTRDWHLRHMPVHVLDNKKCSHIYIAVLDSQLCALGIPEVKGHVAGACKGDLGGPLVFENKLIGVLSRFHPHCIDTREPAIYTRVSSVQYFIQSVLDGSPPDNTRVDTDQTLSNGTSTSYSY